MATFTVVTDDVALFARLSAAVGRRDRMFHVPGGFDVPIPRREPGQRDLVVVDARRLGAADAVRAVVELRHRMPGDRRVVGIVGIPAASQIAVVTSQAGRDVDFVLATPEHPEHLGMVLRAVANDLSLTVASAATLEVLRGLCEPLAFAIAGVVLGSGCAIRKVADAADELGCSTTHLRDGLIREGSPHPVDVIHHSQCAYALALARRTSLVVRDLVRLSKLGKPERFHAHCETHLGGRVKTMARQRPDLDLHAFLRQALTMPIQGIEQNAGGGSPPTCNLPPTPRDKRRMMIPLRELPFYPKAATIAA